MMTIPAAILNSLDKNNNIFPTADAVAPKIIKTREKPNENKIVLIMYSIVLVMFVSSMSLLSKFLIFFTS